MPLHLDVCNADAEQWIPLPEIHPDNGPGSLSHNHSKGREVYAFACAPDDSYSTIYHSVGGMDYQVGETRVLTTEGMSIVKILHRNDDPYILEIRPDGKTKTMKVRFTHI